MKNRLLKLVAPVSTKNAAVYIYVVVMCITIVAAGLIYNQLLLRRGPFHWDESLHAMQGVYLPTTCNREIG
jgi:hypothetical protein